MASPEDLPSRDSLTSVAATDLVTVHDVSTVRSGLAPKRATVLALIQALAPAYADQTAANAAEAVNVVYYNQATGKLQITTA